MKSWRERRRNQPPQFAWLDYAAPVLSLPMLAWTAAVAVADPAKLTVQYLRIAGAVAALAFLCIVGFLWQLKLLSAEPGDRTDRPAADARSIVERVLLLLAVLPVTIAGVTLLCVHLAAVITMYLVAEGLIAGVYAGRPLYSELFWFWLDQTFKGGLFDFMEVFSLSISHVAWEPRQNLPFALAVVVWRMFVSAIVVVLLLAAPKAVGSLILKIVRRLFGRGEQQGAVSNPGAL